MTKNGRMSTTIHASCLSMKKRKKKAPVNCASVQTSDGMLSVKKLTMPLTSCSILFIRLPEWKALSAFHSPFISLVKMCKRILFCAFTPSSALIHLEKMPMASSIIRMSAKMKMAVESGMSVLTCVAMSMASFVAHTKAKAEMTESSPMVMFSKACRRYPFHVCHR